MRDDPASHPGPAPVLFTNREWALELFGRLLQAVTILPLLLVILPGLVWHRLTRRR